MEHGSEKQKHCFLCDQLLVLEDKHVRVLVVQVDQDQIDHHESNSKDQDALLCSLLISKFEKVSHLDMACEVMLTLKKYHDGSSHVKIKFFETH
jgi:hypothetical protein